MTQGVIVAFIAVWQLNNVKDRTVQRWSLILGMLAMLGAGVVVPMTATHAAAKPGMTSTSSMAAATEAMPCHKPANPCPNCPHKACPDMGAGCLVKCSQLVATPAAAALAYTPVARSRLASPPRQAVFGTLTPPLLRPPIV